MKTKLLIGLMMISSFAALANDSTSLREDVSLLNVEKESEELEVMDQQLLEDAARKEAKRLEKEAGRLETQISQLRHESERLGTRIDKQSERYKQSVETLGRIELEARKIKKSRDLLKAQVEKQRRKTNKVEQNALHQRQARDDARQEIRQLEREKAGLISRQRDAELSISRLNKQIKKLRSETRRLGQEKVRLQKKVSSLESKADDLSHSF